MILLSNVKNRKKPNIRYKFVYLTGFTGRSRGEQNTINTANVFNQLHLFTINFISLTVFPESELYQEIIL